MVNVAYFVLGVCICLLVVIPYIRFHYHWTNETVADFTWEIVKDVMLKDNEVIFQLVQAHRDSNESLIAEIEEKIKKRADDVKKDGK